jgi:hypothetical protein
MNKEALEQHNRLRDNLPPSMWGLWRPRLEHLLGPSAEAAIRVTSHAPLLSLPVTELLHPARIFVAELDDVFPRRSPVPWAARKGLAAKTNRGLADQRIIRKVAAEHRLQLRAEVTN